VKFLVDMPLSPAFSLWLKGKRHDSVHASELGLDRASDLEIMARAKVEARTIVTADLDYPKLLAMTRATEPSIILFREGDWSEADAIERMSEVLAALTEQDIEQSIVVIEKDRVRRRRLPIKS
jgi:predicted nuclease of predicted toxin-antitoxin system